MHPFFVDTECLGTLLPAPRFLPAAQQPSRLIGRPAWDASNNLVTAEDMQRQKGAYEKTGFSSDLR